jgi:hypothetical protein
MAGTPVLMVLLVVVVAVVALAALARGAAAAPGPTDAVAARTTWWRWAGILAGLGVAYVAVDSGALGRGMLLAAPLFGLCVLAGVLIGELTVRPPAGATRAARVEVRRTRDYLPRALTTVVVLAGGALLALLTVTTAAGSADDLGRAGRSLFRQCTAAVGEGHGPWPGSFYSVPLLGVVLAGLLVAAVVLRRVVLRPRSGGDPAVDDALRRRAARAVVGACGVLVGVPLAGVSLVTAGGLRGISCAPGWWTVAAWWLEALVPAILALLGWCAVVLLVPVRTADRVGAAS